MSEPADPMQETRDRLVLAALPHVPFDGWSLRSLRAAARDAGLDETMAERAFPRGAIEAVLHFVALADRRLEEEAAANATELAAMRFTQRIAWLVRRRIEPWTAHREAVRHAVALLALPGHAPQGLRAAWRTADAIWYAAGDTSTDFSYYTRRATLAGVYSATVLCWLDDASEGAVATWGFLDRRLAGVGRVTKFRKRAEAGLKRVPNPLRAIAARRERRHRVRPGHLGG